MTCYCASKIAAVGTVVGDDALFREARAFDAAFRRIRGLRSGIGRRLSGAIRKTFHYQIGAGSGRDSREEGDEIGLPFEELAETIDIAQVLAITGREKVPPHLVDRLLRTKGHQ